MIGRALPLVLALALPFSAMGEGPAVKASDKPADAAAGDPVQPRPRELPFSRDNVLAVVSAHADQIQACYEEAMAKRGSTAKDAPAGRVVLSWTITLQGLPSDVAVKKTEIRDPLVTECMVQAVRFWEFPRPEVPQPIEFPFELKARSGGSKNEKKDKR